MQHNRKLQICIGGSRKSVNWTRTDLMWSEFIDRLKIPVRSTETMEEYLKLPKSQQDDLKDVGGFVGGTLTCNRRKAAYVNGRDLVTLDLDNIPAGQTEDILRRVGGLECGAVVYSTRKHTGYAPRLRVVIPLDRTATADEYEPAARKLASLIGVEFCDPTTFDVSRLMYWPSCCTDGEYVFETFDKPFCSTDGLLNMYGDWKDISQWPQVPGSDAIERRRLSKQEDPTAKRGVIGAFCRTYGITEALDKFIPGMYQETAIPGRYTFTGGSTTGGAVVYDGDLFLYSHHATDPCSGLLVNAFDLVRLHMYGDLDKDAKEGTPVNKLPSFVAMSKLANNDKLVSDLLIKERYENAKEKFDVPIPDQEEGEVDLNWIKRLTVDGNNKIEKTLNNVSTVLTYDPLLKGRLALDVFAGKGVVLGTLPWDPNGKKRWWIDTDDVEFYAYMEAYYQISTKDKLNDGLLLISSRNRINDVERYLKGLKWDGVKRLDTLLPDFLGSEDNAYTRAVMRKSLCAAVARAIVGGVKYDYMPIFAGPQGIGKSTFLSNLGKEWFSDSVTSFEGKDAAELIQGTWINEVGELTAFTKQETTIIKQFLSKKEDIFRAAYGRNTNKYPRRCVFFGTSNEDDFLKDVTGNRRFWPVDVGVFPAKKSIWQDMPGEVDQIWAEAYVYWMLGEPLFLSKELEKMAAEQQEKHREASGKEGLIREFLEKKIPQNWDSIGLSNRRRFWNGGLALPENEVLVERDKVCAVEIFAECFGGNPGYMKKMDSMEINNALGCTPGWKKNKSMRRYGAYGRQRGFEKASTKREI